MIAHFSTTLLVISEWLLLTALIIGAIWAIDEIFFELLRKLIPSRHSAIHDVATKTRDANDLEDSVFRMAILIPAWRDSAQLRKTVESLLSTYEENLTIFVGSWVQDSSTHEEAARLSFEFPQVNHCTASSRFTGSSTACANDIAAFVRVYQDDTGDEFDGYLFLKGGEYLHSSAISIVADALTRSDVVRLPKVSEGKRLSNFITAMESDSRAEFYIREMRLRAELGTLGGPELGLAVSHKVFCTPDDSGDFQLRHLLNPSSLASDYEMVQRLRGYDITAISAPLVFSQSDGERADSESIIGVISELPDSIATSVRARARRMLGACIDGWRCYGWQGGWPYAYGLWRDRRRLILGMPFGLAVCFALVSFLLACAFGAVPGTPEFASASILPTTLLLLTTLGAVLKVVYRHLAVKTVIGSKRLSAVLPAMVIELVITSLAACVAMLFWMRGSSQTPRTREPDSDGQFTKLATTPLNNRVSEALSTDHTPIGELLVEWHVLSPTDRDRALQEQLRTGQRIGNILVNHGLVTESTVLEAAAHQISVDMVEVNVDSVPAHMGTLLSLRSMLKHRVYPLSRSENGRVVLVCYRLPQPDSVLALRNEIDSPIRLCLAKRTEVRKLLRTYSLLATKVDRRFIAASNESITELLERIRLQAARHRRHEPDTKLPPLLGEQLISAGYLDGRTFRAALLQAVRWDQPLNDYLLAEGLVPASALKAITERMTRGNGIRLASVNGNAVAEIADMQIFQADSK